MFIFSTLIGGLIAFIITLIVLHNSLINRKNQVDYAFGGMDALLKKRADLIPNLVKTVKAYMKHEKEILTTITALRNTMVEEHTELQRFKDESQLSGLLRRINIAVEKYPTLKAHENFLQLQSTLQDLEEQISAARRAYNASVYEYNNGVEMFPFNLMANLMNYQKRAFFEISEQDRRLP